MLPEGTPLTNHLIYMMLEHIAGFTLVGYVVAEFHGRDRLRYREIAPRVVGWGGGISLLLEATRGFHPAYGASFVMLVFTTIATAFHRMNARIRRSISSSPGNHGCSSGEMVLM